MLFAEAERLGYLVEKADGTSYLIKNTNFSAALVDLSNPQARAWIKSVIKTEMIDKAGASGWMNDFGEALPFDARLRFGADPAIWHNRYPEEWALVSREVIEEAGRDDIVFFNRSGFTQSPGAATLFWLGDQLQSWDEYDGIKTAVVGLLSGGVSGFSLLHSDTGGYVVLKLDLLGKTFPVIARTPELFMRWIELNAFTAVFVPMKGSTPLFRLSSTQMPIRWRTCSASAKSIKASPSTANGSLPRPPIAAIRWSVTCSCTIRTITTLSTCATSSCSAPT